MPTWSSITACPFASCRFASCPLASCPLASCPLAHVPLARVALRPLASCPLPRMHGPGCALAHRPRGPCLPLSWRSRALDAALDHELAQLGDGAGGIEPLGACLSAIEDRVAAVKPERVLEVVQALAGCFIAD